MGYEVPEITAAQIAAAVQTAIAPFKWDAIENSFLQIAGTGWAGPTVDAATFLGAYLGNAGTPALNDVVSLGSFNIPSSDDFTLYLIGRTDGDYGIIHIFINDVDVAQIDMYGGAVKNVLKNVSLGTLTAGHKMLKFKIASKNGSSSAYKCIVQSVLILPT